MSPALCQACRADAATATVENQGAAPFLICDGCRDGLLAHSLRPRKWYNLAILHGPLSFHLHDDFYDEHGRAMQPEARVVAANAHPAPRLEQVADELDSLMEFCATRFALAARHYLALAQFGREELTKAIEQRLGDDTSPHVRFMCAAATPATCRT